MKNGMRDKVKLNGIPISWDTNLSDDDIRSFYLILTSDPDFPNCKVEVSGFLNISIRLFQKAIPFKDGWCECRGLNNWVQAIYRSTQGWELFHAREREIKEFWDEKNSQHEIAALLFEVEDDSLTEQAKALLASGDYKNAAGTIKKRTSLAKLAEERSRAEGLGSLNVVYKTNRNAVEMFLQFPTSEFAISFFKENRRPWWDYYTFGKDYFFCHISCKRTAVEQTELVFQTATQLFPSESKLYKEVCLFWKRNKEYSLAIEYCQTACTLGLNDDTQKGFAHRLQRLQKIANTAIKN